MEIKYGKLYLNRTWKYLYPALRVYEPTLIAYLNSLVKVAVGIYDDNFVESEEDIDEPKIFVLIQTKLKKENSFKARRYAANVAEFFTYIRRQPCYVDDYLYEITEESTLHMVVIKYPENFKEVFRAFKAGEYHKMYGRDVVKQFFPLASLNEVYNKSAFNISKSLANNFEIHGVLTKDESFKKQFSSLVAKDFGVPEHTVQIEDSELDYPPDLTEEIFNFKQV